MRIDDDQLEYLAYLINRPRKNVTNIYTFKHVMGSANTPEPLPSQENADGFDIVVKALFTNMGTIYIGGSNAQAKNQGTSLRNNDVVSYGVKNCDSIWAMASVAGEGVEVTCELPDVAEEEEEEEEED